jgi:hypothetical protein
MKVGVNVKAKKITVDGTGEQCWVSLYDDTMTIYYGIFHVVNKGLVKKIAEKSAGELPVLKFATADE